MEKKEMSGFSQIGNNIIYCPFLPLEAKAIFAYIKSKPENWKFSSDRMARELACGESTIKKYRALLEKCTTNADDEHAPMLIVKHRTKDGFYTYEVNEPSYEIQPVKIQPVEKQPVKKQPIKKERMQAINIPLKNKEKDGDFKKGFQRRNSIGDEKKKIARHFATVNAEKDQKTALNDAKRQISEWRQANPEKTAEIEKEQRLRLESERPDMLALARKVMIDAAVRMEIRKILNANGMR